jgi:hypothetical protein
VQKHDRFSLRKEDSVVHLSPCKQRQCPPTTPDIDLRVWQRYACELPADCQPVAARGDKDILWAGRVRDVSRSGIGLILPRRFEPDTCLVLEFPALSNLPPETVLVRVVHATPRADRSWLLGCTFLSPLTRTELEACLDLARAQRRAAPKSEPFIDRLTLQTCGRDDRTRRGGKPPDRMVAVPEILFSGAEGAGRLPAFVVRRLYLRESWPLAAGTSIKVWFGRAGENTTAVELLVHDCSRQGERWVVSYSFVAKPSAEVLRLLEA